MMKYEDFVEEIKSRMEVKLGKDYTVSVAELLKNNSVVQRQLVIQKSGSSISPRIHLQGQYERYMEQPERARLDELTENIIQLYESQELMMNETIKQTMWLNDYGYVKDRILYKLVNTKDNQEMLTHIPHIPFLDLSIVFYICISEMEEGRMTAPVTNQHMEHWKVTADELYQAAGKNTPEKMPVRFCTMEEMIFGVNKDLEANSEDEWGDKLFMPELCDEIPPLYVLSNIVGIQGASTILYPGTLKKCAESLQKDLVILPSSTHEVLILPYEEETDIEELSHMVRAINVSDVPKEEWLSDHVYLYRREDDKVTAA